MHPSRRYSGTCWPTSSFRCTTCPARRVRVLPELVSNLLHGERPAGAPKSLHLREMAELPRAQGGWTLLGEREGEQIALGLVGKFWRPVIEYQLSVRPIDDRTLLSGLMRTATADERARHWLGATGRSGSALAPMCSYAEARAA